MNILFNPFNKVLMIPIEFLYQTKNFFITEYSPSIFSLLRKNSLLGTFIQVLLPFAG